MPCPMDLKCSLWPIIAKMLSVAPAVPDPFQVGFDEVVSLAKSWKKMNPEGLLAGDRAELASVMKVSLVAHRLQRVHPLGTSFPFFFWKRVGWRRLFPRAGLAALCFFRILLSPRPELMPGWRIKSSKNMGSPLPTQDVFLGRVRHLSDSVKMINIGLDASSHLLSLTMGKVEGLSPNFCNMISGDSWISHKPFRSTCPESC